MKIKIIHRQGKAVLVEWQDGDELKRVTVPSEDVRGNQVTRENLEKGIVHGEAWEDYPLSWPTSEELARMLRCGGLWTKNDVISNMAILRGIVSAIVARQVAQIKKLVKET